MEITPLGLEVAVTESLESRGIYDVTRLRARKPEVYAIVVRLLGMGVVSKDEIAKLCGVAWETVQAVEAAEFESIRDLKGRFSVRLGLIISAAMDGLLIKARAGKLSALDLAVLLDKWLLVSGEATARVQHVEDPSAAKFREFMAALPATVPPMGSATGGMLQRGGPVIELEPVAEDRPSVSQSLNYD